MQEQPLDSKSLLRSTITPGLRFVHWIIDMFVVGVIANAINLIPFVDLGIFLQALLYPFYYILFEYYYSWTPGKLVSGSIVLNENGQRPDLQTIILRTFCRYVPFEPFSCLDHNSRGWHDSWTKTYVVKKSELVLEANLDMNNTRIERAMASSKSLKTGLIILIIGAFIGSGYWIYVKATDMFDQVLNMTDMTASNSKKLQGRWTTDWKAFQQLNFTDSAVVHAMNNEGEELLLDYVVESFWMTMSDTPNLTFSFMISEIEPGKKIILTDLSTMQETVTLTRQE